MANCPYADDIEARNRIALDHLRLVKFIARRFENSYAPMEDLVQEGFIGLLRALERYDPSRGTVLSFYVTPSITGSIKHYLREKGRMIRTSAYVQDRIMRIEKTTNELLFLGQEPTLANIAAAMAEKEETIIWAIRSANLYQLVSIDQTFLSLDGRVVSVKDDIGGDDIDITAFNELSDLRRAILCLQPACQRMIRLRFVNCLTQIKIGIIYQSSTNHTKWFLAKILVCVRRVMHEMESGVFQPGDSIDHRCRNCRCHLMLSPEGIERRRQKKEKR